MLSVADTVVTIAVPPRSNADIQAIIEQARLLCASSRELRARSEVLRERSRALRERSRAQREARHSVAASRTVEAPAAAPRRPRPAKKLVHKNRWLISADVVAALARAGIVCDILVPGSEPWREKIGWSPDCRPH